MTLTKFTSRTSTVLVVDDQPEVRAVLLRLLEKAHLYDTAEADGAEEALDLLRIDPPDAMILDISMPHMSGLSVIPEVLSCAPRTRILVMSSHDSMEKEILALGADAFLPKTASPRKILAALASVLS